MPISSSIGHTVFLPELMVEAGGPPVPRRLEPVTCGIPWPRGTLQDVRRLTLQDEEGNAVPVQARALDLWPHHLVCWVLLDWQASVPRLTRYQLRPCRDGETLVAPPDAVRAREGQGCLSIETGAARFELSADAFPFAQVVAGGQVIDPTRTRFAVEDEAGEFIRQRSARCGWKKWARCGPR
jgi:hypothetical protein